MEQINSLHTFMMWVITAITLLVVGLIGYICIRFNEKANPKPSKTTHNTLLEVVWTGIPVLILFMIAVPSLKLLYFSDKAQDAEFTLKVTGHQWYWSYEYPDHGGFSFDSNMVETKDLKEGQIRLLSVDNEVVVPAETNIRVLITAADVMHSWAVPALALKKDAVPGRLNETWFRANKPGIYYGQCSELCGVRHGFMPIVVRAVSREEFDQWVAKAQKQFAADGSITLARQ
jgi:cytochrome c oxidase subunit 2